jgi:hypothetical protein
VRLRDAATNAILVATTAKNSNGAPLVQLNTDWRAPDGSLLRGGCGVDPLGRQRVVVRGDLRLTVYEPR